MHKRRKDDMIKERYKILRSIGMDMLSSAFISVGNYLLQTQRGCIVVLFTVMEYDFDDEKK